MCLEKLYRKHTASRENKAFAQSKWLGPSLCLTHINFIVLVVISVVGGVVFAVAVDTALLVFPY